jgi:hypothetical protein
MKKRRGITKLERRMLEGGHISPRAARKMLSGPWGEKGAVGADHINQNGRQWPAGGTMKASNNRPQRRGPKENYESYGGLYGGRNGRP